MYYLYKMNTFFKQVNKQKLFRYILPCPSMKNESSHMTISDRAYIIKGPVVTLNHIVSIPFQIKCLSHKMMRASKSIPGEISSHRRPLRGGIPFRWWRRARPLSPLQVSTPPHWDFTNLLVWPPPSTPPWGERNVIWPAVMRQSHTLCAHRYLKLFPFRGSLWVLRRYHPQMTVGFSPAIPLTWKEGLCLSRLFTSTHWNGDGALPASPQWAFHPFHGH